MRGRTVGALTFAVLVGSGLAVAVSAPAVAEVADCAGAIVVAPASSFPELDAVPEGEISGDGYITADEWAAAGNPAAQCDGTLVVGPGQLVSTPPTTNPEPSAEPSTAPSEVPVPDPAPSEPSAPAPTASTPAQPQATVPPSSSGSSSSSSGAPPASGSGSTTSGSNSSGTPSTTARTTTTSASGALTTAPVSIAAAVATPPVLTQLQVEAASEALEETRSTLPVTIDPSPVLLSDQASATGSPIVSPNDTGMLAIVVGMSAISIGCAAFSVVLRRRRVGSRHSI